MSAHARTGCYTFHEFLELIREDQKADLLDGVIYMASPENLEHNDLERWLTLILGGFAEARSLGRVTIGKVAFRLSNTYSPEPDVAFVRASRSGILKRGYVDGPPDLAVEIVSPESVDRDYELKRGAYEKAGVEEYWILDPDERRATFLRLAGDRYADVPLSDHVFESAVLPGFRLDVRHLWQRPLPPALPLVQALLGA